MIKDTGGFYAPYGWEHWPEWPMWSYQFRRGLGEIQEGGGAVSEVFQAASRMEPGNDESWHQEYIRIADRNRLKADRAIANGHIQTARNSWMRAANYYRQAEFWLSGGDERRRQTFDKGEACTTAFLQTLTPEGEVVEIPYVDNTTLRGYFIRSPWREGKQPVLISFGGLDSHKDELWFMTGRGAIQRGLSVLMVDGPGQGRALRHDNLVSRYDYEVPVGKCIDYLETRDDIDKTKIAVSGSSLGGYYALRAACVEHRLAACVTHGAIWDFANTLRSWERGHPLERHFLWVFGKKTMEEVIDVVEQFDVRPILNNLDCPYLIVHGGHDVLGVKAAGELNEACIDAGVNVTFRVVTEEETGADHCQHDNPTIGQEIMIDWLLDTFNLPEYDGDSA